MMKLKYLFNNEDLALMCLHQWDYDEDSIELFQHFRISSNAIYPFKQKGRLMFLRFSPEEEKSLEHLQSEVQLIEHLLESNIHVPHIIPSKNNMEIETLLTPWGTYHAAVFEGIPSHNGFTLEDIPLNDNLISDLGAQLAMIHNALNGWTQTTCYRPSFDDILFMMKEYFQYHSSELDYVKLVDQLSEELSLLPRTSATYGLLHYDYELDNLILSAEDQLIYTIDFDDACYGWYDLDITIAVKNIVEESPYENLMYVRQLFMKGYQSIRPHTPLTSAQQLTLTRFERLYQYFRIIRSVEETYANEPEWMSMLRNKLDSISTHLSQELFTQ